MSLDRAAADPANDNLELQAERRLIFKIVAMVCTVSLFAVLACG